LVLIGCDVNSALERVSEAQHLSADLLVQFTKAADAANRAVMADTDEASVEFALKFSAEGTDLRDAAETIEPRQTFESHRS